MAIRYFSAFFSLCCFSLLFFHIAANLFCIMKQTVLMVDCFEWAHMKALLETRKPTTLETDHEQKWSLIRSYILIIIHAICDEMHVNEIKISGFICFCSLPTFNKRHLCNTDKKQIPKSLLFLGRRFINPSSNINRIAKAKAFDLIVIVVI